MKNKLDYNINWSEYFRLDESSPSFVVRIKTHRGKLVKAYNVGTKSFKGNDEPRCWVLRFKGKLYLLHRIIYVLFHGNIDSNLVIDHLDGNPFNNLIGNLSLKTQKDNNRNVRKSNNNSSGITGVRRVFNGKNHFYYVADWCDIKGVYRSKSFSVLKLGESEARTLAIAHRKNQIELLIANGAIYTDRHGT